MRSFGRLPRLVAWLALGLPLVTACTTIPVGRFEALAESSRSVLDGSSATYSRIEGLQWQYMVFNPADGRLTPDSFKPVVVDDQGRRQDFDLRPRLRFRETALEALADYTDVLQAFAKKDYQGDLDKATQKLSASLGDLTALASANPDAQKAAGVLATAVNALGRAAIERVRRNTLQDAMATAQPGIATLADLIAADNALIAQAVRVMQGGIVRAANNMRPAPSPDRVLLDERVARVLDEGTGILASLDALGRAVKTIPAAHAEIRESLDDERPSLAKLQSLIAEAKRLNKFYGSVK
jgi:hypothetical protein